MILEPPLTHAKMKKDNGSRSAQQQHTSHHTCVSQGGLVPRPNEREHAHWFSQPSTDSN